VLNRKRFICASREGFRPVGRGVTGGPDARYYVRSYCMQKHSFHRPGSAVVAQQTSTSESVMISVGPGFNPLSGLIFCRRLRWPSFCPMHHLTTSGQVLKHSIMHDRQYALFCPSHAQYKDMKLGIRKWTECHVPLAPVSIPLNPEFNRVLPEYWLGPSIPPFLDLPSVFTHLHLPLAVRTPSHLTLHTARNTIHTEKSTKKCPSVNLIW
jgi:hypothetical protein